MKRNISFFALLTMLAAIAASAFAQAVHRRKCGKHCPVHGARELCDNPEPGHTVCTYPCQHLPE